MFNNTAKPGGLFGQGTPQGTGLFGTTNPSVFGGTGGTSFFGAQNTGIGLFGK